MSVHNNPLGDSLSHRAHPQDVLPELQIVAVSKSPLTHGASTSHLPPSGATTFCQKIGVALGALLQVTAQVIRTSLNITGYVLFGSSILAASLTTLIIGTISASGYLFGPKVGEKTAYTGAILSAINSAVLSITTGFIGGSLIALTQNNLTVKERLTTFVNSPLVAMNLSLRSTGLFLENAKPLGQIPYPTKDFIFPFLTDSSLLVHGHHNSPG
ncbi:MAG: hypothetical protein WCN87_03815 [Chlamydiota bacterium]